MPVACVIAVSILCVPWDEATVRVVSSSFGQSAVVQSAEGDVSVEYWSDEMPAGDWDGAARLCRGSRCVEYRRQDDGPQSIFLIRRAGCDLGRRVLVTSQTVAGRDRLLAAFAVVPVGGDRSDAVALAELSERRPMPAAHAPAAALACAD